MIASAGAESLATALKLAPLHTLELGRNYLGPAGAKAFANVLRLPCTQMPIGTPGCRLQTLRILPSMPDNSTLTLTN